LPGKPLSLEKLREKIIERYGILGMSALRYYLGEGSISANRFKQTLKELNVTLSRAEFSQVIWIYTYFSEILFNNFLLIRLWLTSQQQMNFKLISF
jgi:hypothetical protein